MSIHTITDNAQVIWKFELPTTLGTHFISMPRGAKVLRADVQAHDRMVLWAICDTAAPDVARSFFVAFTGGRRLPQGDYAYINTVTLSDGIVLHIFEQNP